MYGFWILTCTKTVKDWRCNETGGTPYSQVLMFSSSLSSLILFFCFTSVQCNVFFSRIILVLHCKRNGYSTKLNCNDSTCFTWYILLKTDKAVMVSAAISWYGVTKPFFVNSNVNKENYRLHLKKELFLMKGL